MTGDDRAALGASEQQFMDSLIMWFQQTGYTVAHIPDRLYALAASQNRYDALSGAKGLPDIIAIGHGHLFVIEAKSDTGVTSAEQDTWLDEFCALRGPMCFECSERVHVMKARPHNLDEIIALMVECREASWKDSRITIRRPQ